MLSHTLSQIYKQYPQNPYSILPYQIHSAQLFLVLPTFKYRPIHKNVTLLDFNYIFIRKGKKLVMHRTKILNTCFIWCLKYDKFVLIISTLLILTDVRIFKKNTYGILRFITPFIILAAVFEITANKKLKVNRK